MKAHSSKTLSRDVRCCLLRSWIRMREREREREREGERKRVHNLLGSFKADSFSGTGSHDFQELVLPKWTGSFILLPF